MSRPKDIHATIFAPYAGKAIVQNTAIEIVIDHLLYIGTPKSVLP